MSETEAGSGKKPIVQINGVTKSFGDHTVLKDIDLKANKGDFISLVGPSGCGKSTLLKVISGLHSVTSGEVIIDGMEPKNAREEMSFIFQEANLLPWLKVQTNAELPLKLRGESRDRRAEMATKMLELVNLSHALGKFPWQLSGGMKMRVSIARALTLSPKVLLLDEPFGALDEMTRDNLNEDLLKIHSRDGWTAFFVTHSAAEAVFLSNRIVVLGANPGHVAQDIKIDLPEERDAAMRESREYLDYVAEVSHAIRTVH